MSATTQMLERYLGVRPHSTTEATLRLLIWTGLQMLGADEGSLLVLDEEASDLRFAMQVGNEASGTNLIGQRLSLGTGLTGLAAVTGEVQIGSPTYRDLAQTERVGGGGPEAVIAAPMVVDEKVIGVLTGVSFTKGHRFDTQLGRMFGGFAVIAGVVVMQEQRIAALLADAAPAPSVAEPEVAARVAALARLRPDAMDDVAALLAIVEKLARPQP